MVKMKLNMKPTCFHLNHHLSLYVSRNNGKNFTILDGKINTELNDRDDVFRYLDTELAFGFFFDKEAPVLWIRKTFGALD